MTVCYVTPTIDTYTEHNISFINQKIIKKAIAYINKLKFNNNKNNR